MDDPRYVEDTTGDDQPDADDVLRGWGDEERGDAPPRWDVPTGGSSGHRPTRRNLLLVVAVAPWLVVAAVALRSGQGSPSIDPAVEPTDAAAPPAADPLDPDETAGATVPPDALVFGARVAPGAEDAAAVAVAVARSWLGDAGPPLDLGLGGAGVDGYLEHIAVESVDLPLPDVAVVSLVAIMLDADGETWSGVRLLRLAVPVRLAPDGARPAGTPWLLPAPDLSMDEPEWVAVEEPEELAAAGAAVVAAGYRDVEVHRLERSESWPLRATITAVAPGMTSASDHVVWLRQHLGDYVVAGLLPSAHGHDLEPQP